MILKKGVLALVLGLGLLCCSGLDLKGQNLIQNGDFTQGKANWVVWHDASQKALPLQVVPAGQRSGQRYGLRDNHWHFNFVELRSDMALQQRIRTEVGKRYTLVFAVSARPQTPLLQLVVSINGRPWWLRTLGPWSEEPSSFVHYAFSFEAQSETTLIGFDSPALVLEGTAGPLGGVYLTDVHCVPEKEVQLKLNYQY